MPYSVDDKLVIALASSALFDLKESDRVFVEKGEDAYRAHQREHETVAKGVAFPFIRRLLNINGKDSSDKPVEVIMLSRNDPDTGSRVFNSIEHYKLDISRAVFVSGQRPYKYMSAFNAKLFLSSNKTDVEAAMAAGFPAGQVLGCFYEDDQTDKELRIAFDFDGVLASDESEKVFQAEGLPAFHASESKLADQPLSEGPLHDLVKEVARLQSIEHARREKDANYKPRIRTAIITARNAPAHKRLVSTLRHWGITVDETFLMGGLEKKKILEVFKPHIFFDDQSHHLTPSADVVPCVHVPFGIKNAISTDKKEQS